MEEATKVIIQSEIVHALIYLWSVVNFLSLNKIRVSVVCLTKRIAVYIRGLQAAFKSYEEVEEMVNYLITWPIQAIYSTGLDFLSPTN